VFFVISVFGVGVVFLARTVGLLSVSFDAAVVVF
jgi:hypothetical protein